MAKKKNAKLVKSLKRQIALQQQLIDAQQKIIELQQELSEKTPANPDDNDVFWHIASGGIMSQEAATSDDLAVVRQFQQWNIDFAKKYIKPYVNPKVFSECLNQMTRGLNERIAEIERKKAEEKMPAGDGQVIKLAIDGKQSKQGNG